MLLWVAWYNGYPTVYPDTGSYLFTGAFHRALPPYRSPAYSSFQELSSLGTTAWYIVLAQAILVAFVLWETCKHVIGGSAKARGGIFFAIVCGLAALTSLPWVASQLMPDVFAGVAFLCAYLVAFAGELSLMERAALAAVMALAVAAHMSLFPITAIFVALLVISRLVGWRPDAPTSVKTPSVITMAAWLLMPILAAGYWTASLNQKMGLGFRVSVSGNEFFLASLFGKGLAGDYLRESCPTKSYAACRYLGSLPKTPEQFLFWSPVLPAMNKNGDEMVEVLQGTIEAHPVRFAVHSTEDTLQQLVSLRTGDEIRASTLHAPNTNGLVILQVLPGDAGAFVNDKQSRDRMNMLTWIAGMLDVAVFWLSAAGCVYFAWRDGSEKVNTLFFTAIAFLVINAAICATLAGVYDRYQSRVAWVVPLCLAFYAVAAIRERKSLATVRLS